MTTSTPQMLVEYDEDVIKVDAGDGNAHTSQKFTCPEARNHFFAFGCAPHGGRHVDQGPIDPEPFAFVYACGTVITADPGDPMADHRELVLHPGDEVYVKHYGWHTLKIHPDGYNLNLVKKEAS